MTNSTFSFSRVYKIGRILIGEFSALRKFLKLTEAQRASNRNLPKHFVQSFIELGPTFIKIGQILSTRPDLMPKEYIKELEILHANVPPFDIELVKTMIKQEFGKTAEEVFHSFQEQPVASASLAQVHFAVLKNGEEVAVKIQRPNVEQLIQQDMMIITKIVSILERLIPRRMRKWNLGEICREFERYTLQELDFTMEAKTLSRFAGNFSDWDDVHIPRVYQEYTTPRILTMERVSGLRLHEAASRWPLEKRKVINKRLIEMEMKMFVSDGFFHADLHPGNIFFTDDGKIILIDFGMYGELKDDHRDHFILYWLASVQKQTRRAFHHLIAQTKQLDNANEEGYYAKFKEIAESFYEKNLSEQSITQTYLDIITNGIKYGFVFPSDLILHAKAITTAESLAFTLVPNLKFDEESKPIIIRQFAKRITNIKRLKSQLEQILPEILLFGELPPAQIRQEAKSIPMTDSIWKELLTSLSSNIGSSVSNTGIYKKILNPFLREGLSKYYSNVQIEAIIDMVWIKYADLEKTIPDQKSLGGETNVRLAAFTIALYHTLMAAGKTIEETTQIIYEICWNAYSSMADIPWSMAGLFANDPYNRIRLSFKVFFNFPFSEPSYRWEWKDIEADSNVVGFDCLKCPVAEFFASHNLSELCVNTWCNLDYPLAEQWDAVLERTGTIASGAKCCDFRWRAKKNAGSL